MTRQRNYFPTPNKIFSLGLSPGEFAVYSYLLRCENRHTHQCWPSYKTIGAATRMSVNTVRKHICCIAPKVQNPYIFPSPVTGEMYHPDSVVKLHEKILKDANLEHIRFHDLRHPYVKYRTKYFIAERQYSIPLNQRD